MTIERAELQLRHAAEEHMRVHTMDTLNALRSAKNAHRRAMLDRYGVTCETCDGFGGLMLPQPVGIMAAMVQDEITCPDCKGEGRVLP